jgi:SAM-dependent methyltransferase
MPRITDRTDYWNHYAAGVTVETPEEALKNAFGWTQYDAHGPGDELLGDPMTALELGSGRGNAVAALATKGIDATGIDLSPAQVTDARNRWGHLPNAHYIACDVLEFLDKADQHWDAIYSIWGALWFTDPQALLPRVHDQLASGGKLVFSHAPAVPGCYGIQGMYGNGFKGRQVWIYRWSYEPNAWSELLHQHGFVDISTRVEPAPEQDNVGTLFVEARRGR